MATLCVLPRRKKRTLVSLFLIMSVSLLSVMIMLANLDNKPLFEDSDLGQFGEREGRVRRSGLQQWERKPQAHLEEPDMDRVAPKVSFNYNREKVEDNIRIVTDRSNNVKSKLPLNEIDEEDDPSKIDKNEDVLIEEKESEEEGYSYDESDEQNSEFKKGDFDENKNKTGVKAVFNFEEEKRNNEKVANYQYHDAYDAIYQEENRLAREEAEEEGKKDDYEENNENEDIGKRSDSLKYHRTIKQNVEYEVPSLQIKQIQKEKLDQTKKVVKSKGKVSRTSAVKGLNVKPEVETSQSEKAKVLSANILVGGKKSSKLGEKSKNIQFDKFPPVVVDPLKNPRTPKIDLADPKMKQIDPQQILRGKNVAHMDQVSVKHIDQQRITVPKGMLDPYEGPSGTDQKNQKDQNGYKNNLKDPNGYKNTTNGYRKDQIDPADPNMDPVDLQRIETQIPLQRGVGPVEPEAPATQIQQPQPGDRSVQVRTMSGMPIVEDRIFWSSEVEDLVPQGNTEAEYERYLYAAAHEPVAALSPATWNKCGRPKNAFLQLANGSRLCARYRQQHSRLVMGELLSFYLSRLLGLDAVPLVALARVNLSSPQWGPRRRDVTAAGWADGVVVALIQWVDGLDRIAGRGQGSRVFMPKLLLEAYESRAALNHSSARLGNQSAEQLSHSLQWSDLIVLDYITGHYDRIGSMQDAADTERRPAVMHESIRNLRQSQHTGKLWFIDNECGLLDAYSLIYVRVPPNPISKFYRFHQQMLRSVCLFRKGTIEKLERLAALKEPAQALVEYAEKQEVLFNAIPRDDSFPIFLKYFHKRLKEVLEWVQYCKEAL